MSGAVAASSAFPPFLSPARLNMPDGTRFTLTDGGVYDNLGLEPVVKNCATIYVSDGGGSFPIQASNPSMPSTCNVAASVAMAWPVIRLSASSTSIWS